MPPTAAPVTPMAATRAHPARAPRVAAPGPARRRAPASGRGAGRTRRSSRPGKPRRRLVALLAGGRAAGRRRRGPRRPAPDRGQGRLRVLRRAPAGPLGHDPRRAGRDLRPRRPGAGHVGAGRSRSGPIRGPIEDPAGTTARPRPPRSALSPAEAAQLQQRLVQPGAKTNADKSEFEYVRRQVDDATSPTKVKALEPEGHLRVPRRASASTRRTRSAQSVIGAHRPRRQGHRRPRAAVRRRAHGHAGRADPRARPAGPDDPDRPPPGGARRAGRRPAPHHRPRPAVRGRAVPARDRSASTSARGGMVIVMDTHTGDLVALANVRVDDQTGRPELAKANLAAVDTYEPGSVNKVITASAAIQEGTAGRVTLFDVPYQYQYADHVFIDAEPHKDAVWSLQDIVVHSSNIGTIKLAETLGQRPARAATCGPSASATRRRSTSPARPRACCRRHTKWRGTENATIAYGQGVGVTALQMVAAVNTIANGGTYVAPRLVVAHHRRRGQGAPRAGVADPHGALGPHRVGDEQGARGGRVQRHRHPRRGPGLHGGRQDGHGLQGAEERHLRRRERQEALLRLVRRLRAGRGTRGSRCSCRSTSRGATTTAAWWPHRCSSRSPRRRCASSTSRRPWPEAAARPSADERARRAGRWTALVADASRQGLQVLEVAGRDRPWCRRHHARLARGSGPARSSAACGASASTATHFAAGAVDAGASALLVEQPLGLDRRPAAGRRRHPRGHGAARRRASTATRRHDLVVVGVTGTNGKTTTTHLLAAVLERPAGRPA